MSEAAPTDWSDDELLAMDTSTSADELAIKRRPVGVYIDRLETYGKEASYITKTEGILREYQAFLAAEFDEHPCNIDDTHVVAFNEHLKGNLREHYYAIGAGDGRPDRIDVSDRTRYDYLRRLATYYNWLVESAQIVSANPARTAMDDLPDVETPSSSPSRPKIDLDEMRSFVDWLGTPRQRAFILTLLKTGARLGEVVNIDLCCLTLDHPVYESFLEERGVDLLPAVRDRRDALYLEPGYQAGTEVRGEVREAGVKRQRESGTIVPVDAELKTALLEYLLARRPAVQHSAQACPLFTKSQRGDRNRLTSSAVSQMLTGSNAYEGILQRYGWWEPGARTSEKVTAHYFRHYFTHNHRLGGGVYDDHMPDQLIAYIRGDTPDGTSARDRVYRHGDWDDWERSVREPYLDAIYQFGTYGGGT